MHYSRLAMTGLVAATTVAALTAAPTQAVTTSTTGVARVFKVNPVQSSDDQDLRDQKDSVSAVPASEYADVALRNLDGSGYLSGAWANVKSTTGALAFSDTNQFVYDRSQDEFEQVMAYFWVNQAQEYLQSLGFGSSPDLPAILKRPYDVRINQSGVDNSFMTDKKDQIRLGKGGVDDAEDAEVIVHEYGHAVHNDQVPGFGTSFDAGAIGESFGDYFAVSVGLAAAKQYSWPVKAEAACPMDWDSTSYISTTPHCIRRFDTGRTLQNRPDNWGIHLVGQIWSQALWEIRLGYIAQGRSAEAWDTTLINSQFHYAPATTFQAAAKATYEEAQARDGAKAARLVRDRFAARGITF